MSLAERFATVAPPRHGRPCGFATALAKMSDEDRETVNSIMFSDDDRRISNPQVYQILLEAKFIVPPSTVAAHRRKGCRCFTGTDVVARAEGQK